MIENGHVLGGLDDPRHGDAERFRAGLVLEEQLGRRSYTITATYNPNATTCLTPSASLVQCVTR